MNSLRAALQKAGLDQALVSLRAVAAKFGLEAPISLRRLLEQLQPDQVVFETGDATAGDVSGSAKLALLSTGWWSFKGHLYDSGELYGDNWAFGAVLNHVDDTGQSLDHVDDEGKTVRGVTADGHLDNGESIDFQIDGRDVWITKNWAAIKSKGFRWKLHADPSATPGEVIGMVAAALVIGAVTLIFLSKETSGRKGQCLWTEDENGLGRCEYG